MFAFVLAIFGVFVGWWMRRRMDHLWRIAKPHRRDEMLDLLFFCGRSHWKTGIAMSRAYDPMFDFQNGWYMGFKFAAVQIFAIDESGCAYIGKRNTGRWGVDATSGGMVKRGETVLNAAKGETSEELGVTPELFKYTTLFPCDGISCVLTVFVFRVQNGTKFASTDDTYSEVFTHDARTLRAFLANYNDGSGLPSSKRDMDVILKHTVEDPAFWDFVDCLPLNSE